MTNTFVLPMAPSYAEHWHAWEAVRELIQNAIDRKLENPLSDFLLTYEDEYRLTITSAHTLLPTRTLILGNSDKAEGSLGKFGEGYKLAFLVLAREGKEVIVTQAGSTWRVSIKYNDQFESECLHVEVETSDEPATTTDLTFTVKGIRPEEWEEIDKKFLRDAVDNTVLHDRVGEIFVRGLYVTKHEELKHGYNFGVDAITLNRDRDMCSAFDLEWAASRLHAIEDAPKKTLGLLKSGAADVKYISSHIPLSRARVIVQEWKDENPGFVPVASNEEVERLAPGTPFKIVPAFLRSFLHSCGEFVHAMLPRRTPRARLEALREKLVSLDVPDDVVAELDAVIRDLPVA